MREAISGTRCLGAATEASTFAGSPLDDEPLAIAAASNSVPASALCEFGLPQGQVATDGFWTRLVFVASVGRSRPVRPPMCEYLPGLNWGSSYLPDLEFCTLLSRFRI